MKELDNLPVVIENELKHIIVTDSLKQKIYTKVGSHLQAGKTPPARPGRIWRRVAAGTSFLIILVSLIAVSRPGSIAEAFEPLKKYIPGLNAVVVDDNDRETFALNKPVRVKSADGKSYVEVLSCFTDGNVVKTLIKSNIPVHWQQNSTEMAMDGPGNRGRLIEANVMADGTKGSPAYQWLGSPSFEFDTVVDRVTLFIGGLKVPVAMSEVQGVARFGDFGNVAYANGIHVVAMTSCKGNLLEVRLAGLSDDNKKIFSYANGAIYLLDKSGRKYLPVTASEANPPENAFYFEARLEDGLEVVVPFILLNDNPDNQNNRKEKVSLKLAIPSQGDNLQVNLPVKIGDYTVNIVELKRTVNEDKIVLRSPDGSRKTLDNPCKNGLQIVIDKQVDGSTKDGLYDTGYSCEQKYLGIYLGVIDGKNVYYDCPAPDYQDYDEFRYKVIHLPNFPLDQETLDLTLEDFTYYRKGDWKIMLKQ